MTIRADNRVRIAIEALAELTQRVESIENSVRLIAEEVDYLNEPVALGPDGEKEISTMIAQAEVGSYAPRKRGRPRKVRVLA